MYTLVNKTNNVYMVLTMAKVLLWMLNFIIFMLPCKFGAKVPFY